MPNHNLARHREHPLAHPRMPRIDVALDPVNQERINHGGRALGIADQLAGGLPPWSLFEGAKQHHTIVHVVDKVPRREGYHLGNAGTLRPHHIKNQPGDRVLFGVEHTEELELKQVGPHTLNGIKHHPALAAPVDLYVLNRERNQTRLSGVDEQLRSGRKKSLAAVLNPYHFT